MPRISYQMFFIMALMAASMLSISSSSWFMIWMGMEINTMMFIPLMVMPTNSSAESSLKYFLIQTVGSILFFLASILIYSNINSHISIISSSYSFHILQYAMLMKLGAAPLHFWFPQLIEGLSWINSMILLSWQKIIPLMILFSTNYSKILLWSSILSILFGTLGGLNHLSLRKLMAYSSISHIGWMLMSIFFSSFIFFFYFIMYCFLSISAMLMMMMSNSNQISQIFYSKNNKLSLMMTILSLGGLPPFLGFIPKWMILNKMISEFHFLIPLLFTLTAVITLIYYIRIIFFLLLMMPSSLKWSTSNMKFSFITIMITMSNLCSLPIFILLM